jgi:3-hydroxy-9,10-secoandrosta-1,3,5(10)-triene-9,17-dione monooxygenase
MKLVLRRNFDVLLERIRRNQPLEIRDRLHYRCQAAMVVDRCARHAAELLNASGARGIFNDFPIVRHLQDIQAGRTHYANNPDLFARNYGAVLLGRDNTDFFI